MAVHGSAGGAGADSRPEARKRGCLKSWITFFAVLIPLCLLVLVAFAVVSGDPSQEGGAEGVTRIDDKMVFHNVNACGIGDHIETIFNSVGLFNGEKIYDAAYTIDGFGRRVTPVIAPGTRDRFIAFFGGSYAFGHGVEDDETLPFFVGERATGFMPYNYGLRGYGPQQMLERVKEGNLTNEIREKTGYGIYVFIPHHLERLIGGMPSFNLWTSGFPCYELDEGGELVCKGTFRTAHPGRAALYDALWEWPVVSWFGISLPRKRNTPEILKLLATLVKETKQSFEAQFPGSEFLVLLYYEASEFVHEFNAEVAAALAEEGIDYLDGCPWLTPEANPDNFFPDNHPKPAMHERVAQTLVDELGLASSEALAAH